MALPDDDDYSLAHCDFNFGNHNGQNDCTPSPKPPAVVRNPTTTHGGFGSLGTGLGGATTGTNVYTGIDITGNEVNPAAIASTTWMPMHTVVHWIDGLHREHITVGMCIPSGLAKTGLDGKIIPKVGDDGRTLMVKCNWPSILYDTKYLEEMWNEESGFTSRDVLPFIQGCERELPRIRETLGISGNVPMFSTAKIDLHVNVEKDIEHMAPFFDDDEGAQVLYMVLKVRAEKNRESAINFVPRQRGSKNLIGNGPTRAPSAPGKAGTKRKLSPSDFW